MGAQLYISLNTVKTHTHEPYRKLGAGGRTRSCAQKRSGCSIRANHPGDPPPTRPKPGPPSVMVGDSHVTVSLPHRCRRRTGTTPRVRVRRDDVARP
ncbi:MAG: hypothetical protein ACXVII_45875 [Solirubrobacteraceae bacterium]